MGIKIDGGVASQPDTEVLECRSRSVPSAANHSSAMQHSVSPFQRSAGSVVSLSPAPRCEGPTLKASELQLQVELCTRAADLPLVGQLGAKHHWLRTPSKEIGMGQNEGELPGHGEPPPLGLSTQWIDHSKERDKECVVVPDVDVACVERETQLGKDTGPWLPLVNDCHTKTREVLNACSTKERRSGPDFGDPSKTGAGHSL